MAKRKTDKKAEPKGTAPIKEATKEKQRKPLNSVSDKNAADEEVSSSPPKVKQEADRQPEEVDINSDYAPGEDEEEEESEDDPEDLVGSDEDDEDEDQEEQAPNSSRGHAKMARAKRQKTKAPPAVKMAMKRKRSDFKERMAKFFNIVMDDMEGGSSSDDNQPRKPSAAAKGKRPATTQIEWLTDSMKKVARNVCKTRLARRTMFPSIGDITAAAEKVLREEMPHAGKPPSSAITEVGKVMSSTMSKQVRGNLAGRVKTALAAGAYDKVKDCEKELEGAAYRDGPDGPYTDKRFLEVVEKTFYSDGLPKDGVMRPTAAELAFVELGVYWLALKKMPSYPKEDNTGRAGRQAYAEFLEEARRGVTGERLVVPAPAPKKLKQAKMDQRGGKRSGKAKEAGAADP